MKKIKHLENIVNEIKYILIDDIKTILLSCYRQFRIDGAIKIIQYDDISSMNVGEGKYIIVGINAIYLDVNNNVMARYALEEYECEVKLSCFTIDNIFEIHKLLSDKFKKSC